MSTEGLLSLLETHDHLDELFSLHQQSVLVMHWPLATELLTSYRSQLVLHVEQEEHQLLPLFERAGPVDRAPVSLFTGQHKKMFSHLDRISARLETAPPSEDARRAAIEILDLETAFKHLVEHHDGAEVAYFYPTLQRMASEQEMATLLQTCWGEWNRARAALVSVVARAQQELDATSSS